VEETGVSLNITDNQQEADILYHIILHISTKHKTMLIQNRVNSSLISLNQENLLNSQVKETTTRF